MAQITMKIEAVCGECGRALSCREKREGVLEVDPCEKCLSDTHELGVAEGREEE
jgi:hypothetical protein